MTSQINPNNIDGAYPIAGQDNSSQGFRTNFTNTKTNFQYAAGEISELQAKAITTSALTGGTLNNDMNYNVIANVQLQSPSYTSVTLGTFSGGSVTFNYGAGTYQAATIGGNVTLGFTGWPAAGQYAVLRTQLTANVTGNANVILTMPTAVGNGAALTSLQYIKGRANSTVNIGNSGTYVFEFSTNNGGTSVFIQDLTRGASADPTV